MTGINTKFDEEYLDKGINDLAKTLVEALNGRAEGDAQKLKEAWNIKTVKDLGTNKTPARTVHLATILREGRITWNG